MFRVKKSNFAAPLSGGHGHIWYSLKIDTVDIIIALILCEFMRNLSNFLHYHIVVDFVHLSTICEVWNDAFIISFFSLVLARFQA